MANQTKKGMQVRLQRVIKAPPEKVWQFVGTEQGLKEWLGPKEYEPRVGAQIFFDVQHDGHFHMDGEVVIYDPPRELAFTWRETEVGGEPWPAYTTVRVTLEPVAEGTLVTLFHEGFEKLPEAIAHKEYEGYQRGWEMLNDLDQLAERVEAAA